MYIDYFQCPQLFTTFVYISSSQEISLYISPCLSVYLSLMFMFLCFVLWYTKINQGHQYDCHISNL